MAEAEEPRTPDPVSYESDSDSDTPSVSLTKHEKKKAAVARRLEMQSRMPITAGPKDSRGRPSSSRKPRVYNKSSTEVTTPKSKATATTSETNAVTAPKPKATTTPKKKAASGTATAPPTQNAANTPNKATSGTATTTAPIKKAGSGTATAPSAQSDKPDTKVKSDTDAVPEATKGAQMNDSAASPSDDPSTVFGSGFDFGDQKIPITPGRSTPGKRRRPKTPVPNSTPTPQPNISRVAVVDQTARPSPSKRSKTAAEPRTLVRMSSMPNLGTSPYIAAQPSRNPAISPGPTTPPPVSLSPSPESVTNAPTNTTNQPQTNATNDKPVDMDTKAVQSVKNEPRKEVEWSRLLDEAYSKMKKLEDDNAAALKINEALAEKVTRVEKDRDANADVADDASNTLVAQIKSLEAKLESANERNNQQTADYNLILEGSAKVRDANTDNAATAGRLKAENLRLEGQLGELQSEVVRLGSVATNNDYLTKQNNDLVNENATLNNQITREAKMYADILERAGSLEDEKRKLTADLTAMQVLVDALQNDPDLNPMDTNGAVKAEPVLSASTSSTLTPNGNPEDKSRSNDNKSNRPSRPSDENSSDVANGRIRSTAAMMNDDDVVDDLLVLVLACLREIYACEIKDATDLIVQGQPTESQNSLHQGLRSLGENINKMVAHRKLMNSQIKAIVDRAEERKQPGGMARAIAEMRAVWSQISYEAANTTRMKPIGWGDISDAATLQAFATMFNLQEAMSTQVAALSDGLVKRFADLQGLLDSKDEGGTPATIAADIKKATPYIKKTIDECNKLRTEALIRVRAYSGLAVERMSGGNMSAVRENEVLGDAKEPSEVAEAIRNSVRYSAPLRDMASTDKLQSRLNTVIEKLTKSTAESERLADEYKFKLDTVQSELDTKTDAMQVLVNERATLINAMINLPYLPNEGSTAASPISTAPAVNVAGAVVAPIGTAPPLALSPSANTATAAAANADTKHATDDKREIAVGRTATTAPPPNTATGMTMFPANGAPSEAKRPAIGTDIRDTVTLPTPAMLTKAWAETERDRMRVLGQLLSDGSKLPDAMMKLQTQYELQIAQLKGQLSIAKVEASITKSQATTTVSGAKANYDQLSSKIKLDADVSSAEITRLRGEIKDYKRSLEELKEYKLRVESLESTLTLNVANAASLTEIAKALKVPLSDDNKVAPMVARPPNSAYPAADGALMMTKVDHEIYTLKRDLIIMYRAITEVTNIPMEKRTMPLAVVANSRDFKRFITDAGTRIDGMQKRINDALKQVALTWAEIQDMAAVRLTEILSDPYKAVIALVAKRFGLEPANIIHNKVEQGQIQFQLPIELLRYLILQYGARDGGAQSGDVKSPGTPVALTELISGLRIDSKNEFRSDKATVDRFTAELIQDTRYAGIDVRALMHNAEDVDLILRTLGQLTNAKASALTMGGISAEIQRWISSSMHKTGLSTNFGDALIPESRIDVIRSIEAKQDLADRKAAESALDARLSKARLTDAQRQLAAVLKENAAFNKFLRDVNDAKILVPLGFAEDNSGVDLSNGKLMGILKGLPAKLKEVAKGAIAGKVNSSAAASKTAAVILDMSFGVSGRSFTNFGLPPQTPIDSFRLFMTDVAGCLAMTLERLVNADILSLIDDFADDGEITPAEVLHRMRSANHAATAVAVSKASAITAPDTKTAPLGMQTDTGPESPTAEDDDADPEVPSTNEERLRLAAWKALQRMKDERYFENTLKSIVTPVAATAIGQSTYMLRNVPAFAGASLLQIITSTAVGIPFAALVAEKARDQFHEAPYKTPHTNMHDERINIAGKHAAALARLQQMRLLRNPRVQFAQVDGTTTAEWQLEHWYDPTART